MTELVASPEPTPLPPDALFGEDAVAKMAETAQARVGTFHDPAIVGRIATATRLLLETGTTGEPVLKFQSYGVFGGYLRAPIFVQPSRYPKGEWCLTALVDGTGTGASLNGAEVTYDEHELFRCVRLLDPPPLVVGQEAIRTRLAAHQFESVIPGPADEELSDDIDLLLQLSRTGLTFDEFCPIAADDRTLIIAALRNYIFKPRNRQEQADAFEALAYCEGLDSQQRDELFTSICDDLVVRLPVRPGEHNIDPIALARGLALHYAADESMLFGKKATPDFLHASLVSHLYRDLSNLLDDGRAYEPVVLPSIEISEPPEPRELAIFSPPTPSPEDIQADVRYLRELQAAGYPITLAVERDYDRMKMGVARVMHYVFACEDPVARAAAFKAIEYLYNLQRDEQRDELYRLLTLRVALTVPLEAPGSMDGYVGVAQTMGDVMPLPPTDDQGRPLPQPARTAAMLGRIFYARAQQIVTRLVRTYHGEDEESLPSESA